MANISKKEVLKRLSDLGIETGCTDYGVLCKMLKDAAEQHRTVVDTEESSPESVAEEVTPLNIHLESRIPKRNTFLADAVRTDRDALVLNTEIRKRIYKGKIAKITTVKYIEPVDGDWLTTFDIELKD